ncbi:conjugal transfer protein TraG [Desulfosarcina ovata subsp. sediminis]|uniref:Conjugal transfer protein TraG n=1 Tax=Desulfosarcina ovata subsp. sediminis TaxID=885957 RepID=A0A5K7ZKL2_9BACT|nr:TraM recognition domain-containing protein [Desulfosarcina ovata]BBO80785.1 conjugal transfer protein TraG [Desulfosarcina ovata subsp. sediminis]
MLWSRKRSTLIGHGVPIHDLKGAIRRIDLPDRDRIGHIGCFGTTRIGKSKLIENMVAQDIAKGYSVVIVDPKGDLELFSKIVQIAHDNDRGNELCLINPIYPEFSATINPLAYYFSPEEIVNHVVAGVQAKDAYFHNVAYETTLMIVLSLLALKAKVDPELPINFAEISRRCGAEEIEALMSALTKIEDPSTREIVHIANKILQAKEEFFGKVTSSLRTVLTALSIGNMGRIIGKARSNRFVKSLENGKRVILVVQTGSMLSGKVSDMMARILISMIQSFIGRRFASGQKIDPPLSIYIDEFSNACYMGIEDLFNKAGGAGAMVSVFTQSLADITAAIGDQMARKILDNLNTKIFMRVNDPLTARYVSDSSGTRKKYDPFLQLGGGITMRCSEEAAVRPEDVLNLNRRIFFLFGINGRYKGKTELVKPSRLKVEYPDIISKAV